MHLLYFQRCIVMRLFYFSYKQVKHDFSLLRAYAIICSRFNITVNVDYLHAQNQGKLVSVCLHRFSSIFESTISPLVASAVVRSKAVVLLLIFCLMYSPLFVGVLCLSLFCYALLCVHSSFAIILKRKRKLVALLLLSYRCIITKKGLWLFFKVPWVDLQCVIVVFPDHTHLLFELHNFFLKKWKPKVNISKQRVK